MDKQKGVVHILLLVIIIAAIVAVYYFVSQGKIKLPGNVKLPGVKQEASVSLQTQNVNPFDTSSQYENPFNSYKNPFNSLKK